MLFIQYFFKYLLSIENFAQISQCFVLQVIKVVKGFRDLTYQKYSSKEFVSQ